jgi:hypothetical protein
MKKVVILGATGSVGEQALEVVSGSMSRRDGLAASSSWERLVEQARTTGARRGPRGSGGAPRRRRPGTAACWRAMKACES